MNEEQKRQFYANKPSQPHTINMNGKKLVLNSFPDESKKIIMDRLAEKDPILKLGSEGILPGLKIDGRQVTRDNLKEFEIDNLKNNKKLNNTEIVEKVNIQENIIEKEEVKKKISKTKKSKK
jgi:hypothetical protein